MQLGQGQCYRILFCFIKFISCVSFLPAVVLFNYVYRPIYIYIEREIIVGHASRLLKFRIYIYINVSVIARKRWIW